MRQQSVPCWVRFATDAIIDTTSAQTFRVSVANVDVSTVTRTTRYDIAKCTDVDNTEKVLIIQKTCLEYCWPTVIVTMHAIYIIVGQKLLNALMKSENDKYVCFSYRYMLLAQFSILQLDKCTANKTLSTRTAGSKIVYSCTPFIRSLYL